MTDDLLKRINLEQLYPPFAERIRIMLEACRERGADYFAISGFRSYLEQAELFAQGRTTIGKKVTNAKPGESAHNFGIAVDFCRDADATRAGLQPGWKPEDYAILGEEAERAGLVWGGDWAMKDLPHVQLAGFVTRLDLQPLRKAFVVGGLPAVFAFLDSVEVVDAP